MKEIGEIYLGHMNNGAHYLYVSDILARAEADTKVNTKAATEIVHYKREVLGQKAMVSEATGGKDESEDGGENDRPVIE